MMESKPVVEVKNITKTFGGTRALDDVSIDIYPGEIHSFVGVNGAGKSTLMKILLGVYGYDGGRILVNGKPVHFRSPEEAISNGVAMVYQELNLFPKLTVCENILMGRFIKTGFGLVDKKGGLARCREFLSSVGIPLDAADYVDQLSLARKQLVEIAKCVYQRPNILILDEPSSSLSYDEQKILHDIVRNLKEQGLSILFITHKMEELEELSDRITILRDGRKISTGAASEYTLARITEEMLGKNVNFAITTDLFDYANAEDSLDVQKLNYGKFVRNVSFSLKKGEILAITGLVGCGKSEVARALFGIFGDTGGEVRVNGKKVNITGPVDAIRNSIAYMPISRKEEGIFSNFDVTRNISVASLDRFGFFIRHAQETAVAEACRNDFNIKVAGMNALIGSLSGGNQQKAVLARWVSRKGQILILDEPTRGIDVGAKREIYIKLRQLSKEGISILLVSSEIDEILGVAHRILVMRNGAIGAELFPSSTTEAEIMQCMMARN
ncbi:MAG: sugar ABC transporter ATP-binding protein [Treponema sp.]|jgi:ABC-type sugar transport system ATPase subunit|nr:sugar ABC transporter ATP-binding protein [Treponema sp.]